MKDFWEKMKEHPVRWACRILAPLMMAVIFYFSSRPGQESDLDSLGIGMIIGEMVPGLDDIQARIEFAIKINRFVRKTAHFLEYATLSALITGAVYAEDKKKSRVFLTSVCIAALYAASDEFHQTFVPERSGQPIDVMLDSAGALFGSFIALVMVRSAGKKDRPDE